jgi:hypothetical protein
MRPVTAAVTAYWNRPLGGCRWAEKKPGRNSLRHEHCTAAAKSQETPSIVRLKITQALSGSIDGLQLDRFELGRVYEIGTDLSNYLLAIGAAEPAAADAPVASSSLDQWLVPDFRRDANLPRPLSEAPDRPRGSRRRPPYEG